LADKSKGNPDRGKADFKKAQIAREGEKATAEYKAEGLAVRAKTERLRSLRLSKEAADLKAGVKKKPAKT
jgi:hypothetical protein